MDEPQPAAEPVTTPPSPPSPPAPPHGREGAEAVIRWLRLLGGRERH